MIFTKENNKFAVIDTETTWSDHVMSIGVVIADSNTKSIIDSKYYLVDPEYKKGGMYSSALHMPGITEIITTTREEIIKNLDNWLKANGVTHLFAYNAAFDRNHLPELHTYTWCDIMRLAAYRQYNAKITDEMECCKSGRLKRGFGVEPVLRMLSENYGYHETHNAYYDALDELEIIWLLGHSIDTYDVTIISK